MVTDGQGFPFLAALRWSAGWPGVAVEDRDQAAAGGTSALHGNAGGKTYARCHPRERGTVAQPEAPVDP